MRSAATTPYVRLAWTSCGAFAAVYESNLPHVAAICVNMFGMQPAWMFWRSRTAYGGKELLANLPRVRTCREMFENMDGDDSGSLSADELSKGLGSLGYTVASLNSCCSSEHFGTCGSSVWLAAHLSQLVCPAHQQLHNREVTGPFTKQSELC